MADNTLKKKKLRSTKAEQEFCVLASEVSDDEYCIEALVDSGSKISIIKESAYLSHFSQHELVEETNRVKYGGVNKSLLTIRGYVNVKIRVHLLPRNSFDVKFAVVPDSTMLYDALLGRDFIMQPGMSVTLSVTLEMRYVEPRDIYDDKLDAFGERIEFEVEKLISECFRSRREVEPINYAMKLELASKSRFINPRPRPFSEHEKLKLRDFINDLLARNIVHPSTSKFENPAILHRKKDGVYWFRVDYRSLNNVTVGENFASFPVHCLLGKAYFTSLILKDSFHLVSMEDASQMYTSFVTSDGRYEYLRMPYGLLNASVTFQKFVSCVLNCLIKERKILIRNNAVIIPTSTAKENLEILEQVLRELAGSKLEIRLDKCSFLKKNIGYLGYVIDESRATPNKNFLDAILNYPTPKTTRQINRFLRMTDYFEALIPDYKALISSLRKSEFRLGREELQAFERLKKSLVSPPVLSVYSLTGLTELHIDSSKFGFGAVLMQKQNDGLFHPLFYFNKRRTEVECRHRDSKLQAEAVSCSFRHFRAYLRCTFFTVVTDFQVKKNLESYKYKVERRSTRHVRALSWNVTDIEKLSFDQRLVFSQLQDASIKSVRNELRNKCSKHFEVMNGVLYRKQSNSLFLYVPNDLVQKVIRKYHDDLGHLEWKKTLQLISETYWFPDRKKVIRDGIRNCPKCTFDVPSSRPFETLFVNYLNSAEHLDCENVLVILDYHTKYVVMYPMEALTSLVIVSNLKQYFVHFGCCQKLVTRNASFFHSDDFSTFVRSNGIIHVKASENYESHRFQSIFAKLFHEQPGYRTLPEVQFQLNNALRRDTGTSASRFLFGCDLYNFVSDSRSIKKSAKVAKDRSYASICDREKFEYRVGDFVMVKITRRRQCPKYLGPLTVAKVVAPDCFFITDIEGSQLRPKPFSKIVHSECMKLWIDHFSSADD